MTDDDFLRLFWEFHKERLHAFAAQAANGKFRDAEEGLNDAMRELGIQIVEHFKALSVEDRSDATKAIPPLLWHRIKSRVRDARRRSLRHEMPLGRPAAPLEALDVEPAISENHLTDAAVDKVEKLLTAMNQLSVMEKNVIRLTILREPPMTDDEAAKELGTTSGTVKARRCSGLKKLRQ